MDRDLPTARRWLPLLLAAMLLAQALGLVHRVLHAPASGAALAQVQWQVHDDAFGHDEGDVQCRLFDQLAHGDLAFGAGTAPAAQGAPLTPAGTPPAGRLAPQASGYLARGPPHLTA